MPPTNSGLYTHIVIVIVIDLLVQSSKSSSLHCLDLCLCVGGMSGPSVLLVQESLWAGLSSQDPSVQTRRVSVGTLKRLPDRI